MQVLVTGGAGFIGSHLVDRLAATIPGTITVVDNLYRGCRDNLSAHLPAIRFEDIDIRDEAGLNAVVEGHDVVFHLAAQSNVMGAARDEDYCFTTNVAGTANVLQAAVRAKVKRVVFASSREVYGDVEKLPVPESAEVNPKNAYGLSKARAERLCELAASCGLEVATLRFANVYGTRDTDRVIPRFVDRALQGDPITLYGGEQVVDFVCIDSAVDALMAAAFMPHTATPFNVGSGLGVSLQHLANRILRLTRSASKIQIAPARKAEVTRFIADTRRAVAAFGLRLPADPLEHLPAVIAHIRASGGLRELKTVNEG